MLEILISVGVLGGLLVLALLVHLLAAQTLIVVGGVLVLTGLALATPASAGYHLVLRRGLLELGPTPKRWWWAPTSYHGRLSSEARRALTPFFIAGASGVALSIVGCILAALGAARL